MSNTVILKSKQKGIETAPEEFDQCCYRATGKITEKARQIAVEKAPGSTGRLKGGRGGMGGIIGRVTRAVKKILGILGATSRDPRTGHDYAPDVHEGTGLWGPKKKIITPKKARVLVFPKLPWMPWPTAEGWKKASVRKMFVFTRKVKGQKGQPFLKWGIQGAKKDARHIFDQEIAKMGQGR